MLITGLRAPSLAVDMMRAHPDSFVSYKSACRWVHRKLAQNSETTSALTSIDIVSRAVTGTTTQASQTLDLDTLSYSAEYRRVSIGVSEDCIINMDETSVTEDHPGRRAYARRGSKHVVLKTNGKEKKTITVALAVTSMGTKLKPFIIYKGMHLSKLLR